jgi:hypothetical protein
MEEQWETAVSPKKKLKDKKIARFTPVVDTSKETQQGAYLAAARKMADEEYEKWIKAELATFESGEKTICLMFYAGGAGQLSYTTDVSGYPTDMKGKLSALREVCGLGKKDTVCAEEHILAKSSENNGRYLFSIAYDRASGVKAACSGCRQLLAKYKIMDLAR